MGRLLGLRDLVLWPVVLLLLPIACSRPAETAPEQHRIPFNGEAAGTDAGRRDLASEAKASPDSNLPFDDSQDLPTGTLVTVRLKSSIAADTPDFSGVFEAVVDEAILVDGNTLLPRGADAAGRVESARTSELKRDRSYMRLTLDSIHVNGRELPIHTSSLFVHGKAGDGTSQEGSSPSLVVRLESGRRLTFRLTEPVPLANSTDTKTR